MKSLTLKTAVLAALSLTAVQAIAAGPVVLPTSGATAYTLCRQNTADAANPNFGSRGDASLPPAAYSTCVATNGVGVALNLNSAPEAGYTLQTSNTSTITAFAENIATLNERVFKNGGTCIYAKQVLMLSTPTHDYNPQLTGTQKLEVNDYAFGGYTGAVSVAYAKANANYASVYRAGRTFTSVQMQAQNGVPANVAPGFLTLPTAAGTPGTEIYGYGQTTPAATVGTMGGGLQQAPFSATAHNWVDFTTDATGGIDEDGGTNFGSPTMYIQQACASNATTATAGNFKLRQTGQETQPWVTVTATSRAPGTSIAP